MELEDAQNKSNLFESLFIFRDGDTTLIQYTRQEWERVRESGHIKRRLFRK